MKCSRCQSESPDNANFCYECGNALKDAAKAPSEARPGEASYTPKFLIDNIFKTKTAIEGERKVVTVLFADVANFTHLAEKLDPETTHKIMDACFALLMKEIHGYEGTVNQFRGDGIMALFGAPLAYEDHAQRACHAALGMKSALKKYGEELKSEFGVEFNMRIGLSSGAVFVGAIGNGLRMDYTADGDTANLAARMESMAEPGSILVSWETYKKVRDLFRFRPLGRLLVKGKEDSLEVFELVGKLQRDPNRALRKVRSEIVGREEEFSKLTSPVLDVLKGRGSIVNVFGEAGIGKSRLIEELRRQQAFEGVALLEGRAIAIGKNLSFHPVIDLLKCWAEIGEEDSEEKSLRKVERSIEAVFPSKKEELFPFVATLMGYRLTGKAAERVRGIEGEALERLILKAIRDLLIEASRSKPVVLLLDDLQWADQTTIKYLESLLHLAKRNPILFINVFRTGYNGTSDRVLTLTRERYPDIATDIAVEALAPEACELLIKNLINVKSLPAAVTKRVHRLTEGNPFFIEEIVRSLIDEGALEANHGSFRFTERIDSVPVPETIEEVLLERIDRLEGETKDLLKTASVIGRNFFYKVLLEITDAAVHVDRKLESLMEAQFIFQRRRMGEVEFLFKHWLTQEAAYKSLLLNKRKDLHLKTAKAVERVFKERLHNFYGILAYHYIKGDDLHNASEYLFKAGEESLKSSASSEALYYYQEALKIYLKFCRDSDCIDSDKLFVFEKNIALAFFNKGQYPEALAHLDSALELCGVRSPRGKIAVSALLVFDLLSLIFDLYFPYDRKKRLPERKDHEIFNLLEKRLISLAYNEPKRYFVEFLRALRWARRLDITKIRNGPSRYSGASALFSWTGFSFRLSKRTLDYASKLINKHDFREIFEHSLFELYYNFFTGNWSPYDRVDYSLLERNLQIGRFWRVSTCIFFLCSIRISQGAFADAELLMAKLSEILESFENENAREYRISLEIALSVKSRKLEAAQREIAKGMAFAGRTGRELALSYYLGFKAITQILLKDLGGAQESLSQAEDILAKERWKIPHFMSSCLIGRFSLDLQMLESSRRSSGRLQVGRHRRRARKSGRKAVRNCRKYACAKTEVFRLMGTCSWLCDRQAEAVDWWRASLAVGEALGDRVELARTCAEIGKRLSEKEGAFKELNGIGPEGYLEKARKSFEEMGLRWDLEDLNEAAGQKPALTVWEEASQRVLT